MKETERKENENNRDREINENLMRQRVRRMRTKETERMKNEIERDSEKGG